MRNSHIQLLAVILEKRHNELQRQKIQTDKQY